MAESLGEVRFEMSERREHHTTKAKRGSTTKTTALPELWQRLKDAVLELDRWDGLAEEGRPTLVIAADGSLVDLQRTWTERKNKIVSSLLMHGVSRGALASYCEQVLAEKKEADLGTTPIPKPNRIGVNIRALMEECLWNAEELADEAQLDRTTVFRHMNGRVEPKMYALECYCRAFNKKLKRTIAVADLKK